MKFKSKDEELLYLRDKLKEYETVTRAVYELVNTTNEQTWNDSYSFGEGVEAIIVLQTLVESNQKIESDWKYFDWCEWVKSYKPEGLDK